MKLLIQLLVLSILVSCGGGSTGDITVNGGINVLNDSNTTNAAGQVKIFNLN